MTKEKAVISENLAHAHKSLLTAILTGKKNGTLKPGYVKRLDRAFGILDSARGDIDRGFNDVS